MKKRNYTTIRIILFILLFATITTIMNFVFVQSNWASIDRWEQYSAKDNVDTLFVGSSVGWVVVPQTIDGLNGTSSVNMSTPNQFYKTSFEAVRFISRQQPLQSVVLLTGFDCLERAEDYTAATAFLRAQYETASLIQREKAVITQKLGRYTDPMFLSSVDSVNIWFDWVESFTYTIPEIYKNVAYRLSRRNPGYNLDFSTPIDRINPPNYENILIDDDIELAKKMDLSSIDIDARSLKNLDDMANYLKANDIDFTVIVTPHRSDVMEKYGNEYEIIDSYLDEFVTKRGGKYINIDTDAELRNQLPDDMFMDQEHIVDEGNRLVSSKIAMLLKEE